jgi:hypothetical protein
VSVCILKVVLRTFLNFLTRLSDLESLDTLHYNHGGDCEGEIIDEDGKVEGAAAALPVSRLPGKRLPAVFCALLARHSPLRFAFCFHRFHHIFPHVEHPFPFYASQEEFTGYKWMLKHVKKTKHAKGVHRSELVHPEAREGALAGTTSDERDAALLRARLDR